MLYILVKRWRINNAAGRNEADRDTTDVALFWRAVRSLKVNGLYRIYLLY